ncbi:hypothetical protein KJ973_03305 [Patescibacteria group bacterium]|nr:hypothetical protein [Patescibacteria group bacterium]MBU1246973.1 hypothetical protein [Patescibacteria group bacterium]MBU1519692.1 hypothetical protein [Patescibacteria group bacterium]MBU1730288.1 hypothetical protein [Patescibacteria group bacterium]MBU1956720.1 hypothetical protein [Patescibacteria group bacterium]
MITDMKISRPKLKLVTLDEFIDLGINEKFAEKEIIFKLLEAKLDPKKKDNLRNLFNPK